MSYLKNKILHFRNGKSTKERVENSSNILLCGCPHLRKLKVIYHVCLKLPLCWLMAYYNALTEWQSVQIFGIKKWVQSCPLTLCTSPSDYAAFSQINYFWYLISGWFWKEKIGNGFHFMFSLLSRGGFPQKRANVVEKFLTLISNDPDLKLFTLNQVIDEVNCWEQLDVYFVKIIH